jgi:hypothetical protein
MDGGFLEQYAAANVYFNSMVKQHITDIDPQALNQTIDAWGSACYYLFTNHPSQRYLNYLVLLLLARWQLARGDIYSVSIWYSTIGWCLMVQLFQRALHMMYTVSRLIHFCVLHECWSAPVGVYTPPRVSSPQPPHVLSTNVARASDTDAYSPYAGVYMHMMYMLFGSYPSLPNFAGTTLRLVACHKSMLILERRGLRCVDIVSHYPCAGVKTRVTQDSGDASGTREFTREDLGGTSLSLEPYTVFRNNSHRWMYASNGTRPLIQTSFPLCVGERQTITLANQAPPSMSSNTTVFNPTAPIPAVPNITVPHTTYRFEYTHSGSMLIHQATVSTTPEPQELHFSIKGPARNAYPIINNKLSPRDYRRAKRRLQTLMHPQTRSVLPTDVWHLVLDYFLFLPEMPFPIRNV